MPLGQASNAPTAPTSGADFLLFLNNDVKALDGTWLDEMRARLSERWPCLCAWHRADVS
jgi:hypothetical protein